MVPAGGLPWQLPVKADAVKDVKGNHLPRRGCIHMHMDPLIYTRVHAVMHTWVGPSSLSAGSLGMTGDIEFTPQTVATSGSAHLSSNTACVGTGQGIKGVPVVGPEFRAWGA